MKVSLGDRGFTLLEILVTIIISSILAVILAQVISGQTWRSYEPLNTINENLALRAVMDNIASDHRRLLRTDPFPLITLQGNIDDGQYWHDSISGGLQISAATGCITFNVDGEESASNTLCSQSDTVLKVTLGVQGTQHSQTALFTF